jgi:thiamine-monophosphate kinase
MTSTPLGPGREFDRIRAMAARWKDRARGLGDDCAILEVGGDRIAVSIDIAVEGVHFRREWMSPAEIGYRAAAAALSDLAAVAAEPMAMLLSLGVPADEPEATLTGLADGTGDAAGDAGALIVGGDLTRSDRLIVDCCVIGRASAAVSRSGARPGDRLVVTGALGGPLAALLAWEAGGEPAPEARARFVRPAPRHAAARYLESMRARAMIDISDGLASDAGHLLVASGVGATIMVEHIPVFPAARAAAERAGERDWHFAARSGEEYELLAALPADMAEEAVAAAPVPLALIGTIESEPGLRATERGESVTLPVGFDHFR